MADDAPKPMADLDLAAMARLEGTKETLDAAAELRATRLSENERMNAEYEFPDTYNPKMGLKQGRVTELRMFYTVKPGHAEELKKELHVFSEKEARNSKLVHLMTGAPPGTGGGLMATESDNPYASDPSKYVPNYEAFEQVVNDPEGAKALESPALKPLLDQAAD